MNGVHARGEGGRGRGAGAMLAALVLSVLGSALGALPTARGQAGIFGDFANTYSGDRVVSQVTEDGERVTLLLGNARFVREDLRLRGDRARYYQTREIVEVIGQVEVISDSLTLWTDSLRVFRATDVGHAYGAVRIETVDGTLGFGERGHYQRDRDWLALAVDARVIDGSYVIEGDSISYERADGFMEAFGNVKIVDNENRSVVEGAHGIFDRATGLAVVDSLPVFRTRRGDGPMTRVVSRWMSFDEETETSTAIGAVDFRQGATQARADTARFVGDDLLVLRGSPTVEQEGRVMEGEEIRFLYEEGRLRRIEVSGTASLVDSSPDTLAASFSNIPLSNTLSGDSLRIDVVGGEIVRTYVKGNAHSVYLPEDQEAAVSVNDVRGREIDIHFEDGRVRDVEVIGAVQGVYRYLERRALAALDTLGADSLAVAPVPGDSLATEPALDVGLDPEQRAALADSLGRPVSTDGPLAGVDSLRVPLDVVDFETNAQSVDYTGERTFFQVPKGRIHIEETAVVKYGTLELYAHDVYFDTEARELLAEGDPRLVDRESELVGDRMGYLFEPRTGAVGDGATRFDDGFYYGQHIRRIDTKTLLVRDGVYTTCELEEPHYHFHAKRMKLEIGQKVVARQVTFHLSDIPLITLPFYYKDLKTGRRSGILFPNLNLGVSSREGRYIRDFGYYWATNEYTDFKLEFDYNERQELTMALDNVYNKRYSFNGDVRFSYTRKFEEETEFGSSTVGDEWRLDARHNQPELFDVWRASAEVSLSSSNLTRNNPRQNTNVDLIDSQLRSRASLSRSFDSGASLNLGLNRTQWVNARDDDFTNNNDISNLSSSLGLTFKQGPLLGGRKRPTSSVWANTLRDITFRQSYNAGYDRAERERSLRETINVRGNFGLSYNPDTIGPFRATSSVSFTENWRQTDQRTDVFREEVVEVLPDSTEVTAVVRDDSLSTRGTETELIPSLSFTNSLSTKIYGLFDTSVGPVRGLRHIIDVSASHNFRPEIGDQMRSQSIGLRMGNEFSLKLLERDSEAPREVVGEEGLATEPGELGAADSLAAAGPDVREVAAREPQYRKLDQFVVWDLSTSVDPEAEPGQKWRDITSSVRLRPGITRAIDFSMNQTIDPYEFEVKNTRFNSSLRLRGSLDLGGVLLAREERENRILERLPEAAEDSMEIDPEADDLDPWEEDELARQEREQWLESGDRNAIPWDLYVRGSLTRTRQADGESTSRANLSTQANLGLPGDWKLSWSADFDVERGEFTNQFWRLSRRLHHWRLEFSRGLTDAQDFGFSIYLDAIPDLRIDRGDRARSFGVRDRLDTAF